jgi:hypothetical protein
MSGFQMIRSSSRCHFTLALSFSRSILQGGSGRRNPPSGLRYLLRSCLPPSCVSQSPMRLNSCCPLSSNSKNKAICQLPHRFGSTTMPIYRAFSGPLACCWPLSKYTLALGRLENIYGRCSAFWNWPLIV